MAKARKRKSGAKRSGSGSLVNLYPIVLELAAVESRIRIANANGHIGRARILSAKADRIAGDMTTDAIAQAKRLGL